MPRVEVAKHSILPQLVDTRKAAQVLGRSPATLKRWRCQGTGSSWIEIEGRVSYDLAVLLEYIRENTRVPSVRAAMEESRGIVQEEEVEVLLVRLRGTGAAFPWLDKGEQPIAGCRDCSDQNVSVHGIERSAAEKGS